ncbi:hypothetical protein EI94DRAFT_1701159 [Lactarius quietus]|nr:hypothetical protein EI94DRAFT_1701159 [Lactarius quietus]
MSSSILPRIRNNKLDVQCQFERIDTPYFPNNNRNWGRCAGLIQILQHDSSRIKKGWERSVLSEMVCTVELSDDAGTKLSLNGISSMGWVTMPYPDSLAQQEGTSRRVYRIYCREKAECQPSRWDGEMRYTPMVVTSAMTTLALPPASPTVLKLAGEEDGIRWRKTNKNAGYCRVN